MADRLHVFVSYKKLPGSVTPQFALNIADVLEKQFNFRVFIDERRMENGEKWAERIYQEIFGSDVLVLLLEPETANSPWVQREVDFARGAGVAIFPLRVTEVDVGDATDKLALSDLQYSRYFQQSEADYQRLAEDIQRLALITRDTQRAQYRQREDHWYQIPAEFQPRKRTYRMKNGLLPDLRIHMTVGNILDMPPSMLDVLVNSENDYLQMARFYEVNSLSARIRKSGAYFHYGQLQEDTVQMDLLQAHHERYPNNPSFPIPTCQVLVTRAGHPLSELHARKKVKLIFHAITVQFVIGQESNPVQPLDNAGQIYTTIENCFEQVEDVNRNADLRAAIDPGFDAVRSIAFPLFGTGRGSLPIKDVAAAIVTGIYRSLKTVVANGDAESFSLKDIHLLIYSPNEVRPVQIALDDQFEYVPNA